MADGKDQIGELITAGEKQYVGDKISKFLAPGKDVSWWNFYNKYFGESATIYQIEEIFGRSDFTYEASQAIERCFEILSQDPNLSREQVAYKLLEVLDYQESIVALLHHVTILQKTFGEPMQGLLKIRSSLIIKSTNILPNISKNLLDEESNRIAGYYEFVKFLKRYESVSSALPKNTQDAFQKWIQEAKEFSTYVTPENITLLSQRLEETVKQQKIPEKQKVTPNEKQKSFTTMYALLLHPNFPGTLLKNPVDEICNILGIEDKNFRAQMKQTPPQEAQIKSIDDLLSYEQKVVNLFSLGISSSTLASFLKKVLIPGEQSTLDFMKKAKNILTTDEIYSVLEPEGGFQKGGITLGKCIETFGFSQKTQAGISLLFKKFLGIEKMTKVYWENTKKLILFFLGVESSGGYNTANYYNESSANGYFQYLTGNGYYAIEKLDKEGRAVFIGAYTKESGKGLAVNKWSKKTTDTPSKRITWTKSSYDMALMTTSKTPELLDIYENFGNQISLIGQPKKQNILSLSSAEQVILFLSDICNKPKNAEAFRNTLKRAIIGAEKGAAQSLYDAHHTNTSGDEATRNLRDKHLNIIYRNA